MAEEDMDWREMRARLIAQDRQEKDPLTSDVADPLTSDGFVYESPLIEQGTILLGGTKQDFGFALRQQFFHKSVMLLLQHDDTFTKGIILNRPSALEVDGWRVWCGHGQVAEGGMFVGDDAAVGQLEINALHSLEGFMADRLSTKVIKGVSYTSLAGAKALVAAGQAMQSDFWVCVGYSGWRPGQLQMEYESRDSWYMATADGGTLLKELLQQAQELPPPSEGATTADVGIKTWERLMRGIGREADVLQSDGSLADRTLAEWVRAHLLPKTLRPTPSTPPPTVTTGSVMCMTVAAETGRPADRVLLRDQFLHKALVVVLDEQPNGKMRAAVLNRPTANVMQLNLPDSPRRLLPYGGNLELANQLWLHHKSELGGTAVGDSGVWVLPAAEVVEVLEEERATASDLVLLSGVIELPRAEAAGMISAGEMRVVPPGEQLDALWPRVWALYEEDGEISDGTDIWWLASQCGSETLTVAPPSELADEVLADWLKWFARVRE